MTDKHLVDRVLRGDNAAFATMIRNTQGLVAQMVFKMIPRADDRQDLAQDVYTKVFHSLPGFRFQSKLSTWIGQIAYNTCLSYLEKKKWVLPGDLPDDVGPVHHESEDTLFQKERDAVLQTEIEKLSPIYKVLITLYHQEQMSYEEIGQITGLPGGTVKSYLFRARKALKDAISLQYKKGEI